MQAGPVPNSGPCPKMGDKHKASADRRRQKQLACDLELEKKDLIDGVKSFSVYDFNNRSPFKITRMVLPS